MAKPNTQAARAAAPASPPADPTPKTDPIAEAQAPVTKRPDTLLVFDSSCTVGAPERTHSLQIDGAIQEFTFKYPKPLELDRSIAMKFLKAEGFTVKDHDGKVIDRVPDQPDPLAPARPFILKEDQVVASLSELSTEALLTRCHMERDGEQFTASSPRGRLIGFLVTLRRERDAALKPKRKVRDDVDDDEVEGFEPPAFDPSDM